MVSRREIGILAVLGIGAFFLSRRASGSTDFGGEPATPLSVLQGQKLQEQFDVLGDVIEEQDSALQRLLNQLQTSISPVTRSVRTTLNPTSGTLTQTSTGRDFIVNTFGKVPSNFRQGFPSARFCGSRRCRP